MKKGKVVAPWPPLISRVAPPTPPWCQWGHRGPPSLLAIIPYYTIWVKTLDVIFSNILLLPFVNRVCVNTCFNILKSNNRDKSSSISIKPFCFRSDEERKVKINDNRSVVSGPKFSGFRRYVNNTICALSHFRSQSVLTAAEHQRIGLTLGGKLFDNF